MAYKDKSDEDLVGLLSKQDHRAFEVLVRRHTERFYACAYRYVHDQDEAEDVVQECFLKLWARPGLWKGGKGAKFTTWFYRIVVNAAIDRVRGRKYTDGDAKLDLVEDEEPNAFHVLKAKEEQQEVEEVLDGLPDRQKSALILSFYEDLSNKEAATIMGVGVKAFESLLVRAKGSLKDAIHRRRNKMQSENGEARYG